MRADPAGLHALTVAATTIAAHGHAKPGIDPVVAGFVGIAHAVPATLTSGTARRAVVPRLDRRAVGAAAVGVELVAVVTTLDRLYDGVPAASAEKARDGTEKGRISNARCAAAVAIEHVAVVAALERQNVVRRIGGTAIIDGSHLDHAVAADRAKLTHDHTNTPRLEAATVAATVANLEVTVIALFGARNRTVATQRAGPARQRTRPARLGRSAAEDATVARVGIAIVADLVSFDHTVAAFDARLPWRGTREVEIDAPTVGAAAVVRNRVAVVAPFVRGKHSVAAELARRAGDRAQPAPCLDHTVIVASVARVSVRVVARLRALDDRVAALFTRRPWRHTVEAWLHRAHVAATIPRGRIPVVALFGGFLSHAVATALARLPRIGASATWLDLARRITTIPADRVAVVTRFAVIERAVATENGPVSGTAVR